MVADAMVDDLKTCALVAASDFNAEHFSACASAGEFDFVMAVDGGFAHLQAIDFAPDYVLGDFDSLGYVPAGSNVEVHPAHKDESDLELALDRVIEHGFGRVVIYGALGGRLDHTMAALQVCARFAEAGMEITLIDLNCAVRILVGPASLTLPLRESGTVSVFSATDVSCDVSEWGMEYPLEHARLTNRTTLGLSNELKGELAGVAVSTGTLYVFYPL